MISYIHGHTGGRGGVAVGMVTGPLDLPDDDNEGDHSAPDPHDDEDFGFGANAQPLLGPATAMDSLAAFIKELEDLGSMTGQLLMTCQSRKRGTWNLNVS